MAFKRQGVQVPPAPLDSLTTFVRSWQAFQGRHINLTKLRSLVAACPDWGLKGRTAAATQAWSAIPQGSSPPNFGGRVDAGVRTRAVVCRENCTSSKLLFETARLM